MYFEPIEDLPTKSLSLCGVVYIKKSLKTTWPSNMVFDFTNDDFAMRTNLNKHKTENADLKFIEDVNILQSIFWNFGLLIWCRNLQKW